MRKITTEDLSKISGSSINGYTVEKVRVKKGDESDVDNYGIILAKNDIGLYVTWQFHFEDEEISVYWGHYTISRDYALRDFEERDTETRSKAYKVTITETSKMEIYLRAYSQDEAEQLVSDRWHKSEYILDSDNFVDVKFTAEEVTNES